MASDGCTRRCSVPWPRSLILGSTRSGRTPRPPLRPDAADDQGAADEVLEGLEDGVDEEVVDEVAAEASEIAST